MKNRKLMMDNSLFIIPTHIYTRTAAFKMAIWMQFTDDSIEKWKKYSAPVLLPEFFAALCVYDQ